MAQKPELNKNTNLLVEANNVFAMDLYQNVRHTDHNVIVSPISVQILLGMALQGSRGKTAEEIQKLLRVPNYSNDILLASQRNIITKLDDSHLSLGTKIFIDDSYQLNPGYKTDMIEYFRSDVDRVDFIRNSRAAIDTINNWVQRKTKGKINSIVDEGIINDYTRLVLVNAIYFKATWRKPFDKKDTTIQPFYLDKTSAINVPMMHLTNEKFRYMESKTLGAQIAELPYAGEKFNMLVFLPNDRNGLDALESKLATVNLTEELKELSSTNINLSFPKFQFEQTMDLSNILKKMGIPTAFEDNADFSGITMENVSISTIIQKAFIEVNEEGTEAAAATAGVVRKKRALTEEPEEMICDHPFGFLIVDAATGVVVFMSHVVDLPPSSLPLHSSSAHEEL